MRSRVLAKNDASTFDGVKYLSDAVQVTHAWAIVYSDWLAVVTLILRRLIAVRVTSIRAITTVLLTTISVVVALSVLTSIAVILARTVLIIRSLRPILVVRRRIAIIAIVATPAPI